MCWLDFFFLGWVAPWLWRCALIGPGEDASLPFIFEPIALAADLQDGCEMYGGRQLCIAG
jgi:hypothetical protein